MFLESWFINMVVESIDELCDILHNSQGEIFIAGAGNYGGIIADVLDARHIKWNCFLDQSRKGTKRSRPILPYESINGKNIDYVIISSMTCYIPIKKNIKEQKISEDKIVALKNSYELMYYIKGLDYKSLAQELHKYKDIHEGKRCFVIGTGPSLKIQDLEKLRGDISLASNTIYALYKFTEWRPTYYAANDSAMVKAIFNNLLKYVNETERFFVGGTHYNGLKSIGDKFDKLCYLNTYNYLHDAKGKYVEFPSDASYGVCAGATISYVLLQLAIYMGFKYIYLLGMDFSFSAEQKADGSIIYNNVISHNEEIE